MKSMDRYARKQVILDNLKYSLVDLHARKEIVTDELSKLNQQILRHEEYLERLLEEED